MISNVIVIACTALMACALLWVVVNEIKAPKDTEEDKKSEDKKDR